MNTTTQTRVELIRDWLASQKFDAFILPHEDEFLGEYLPPQNERLQWLTGFTGSAGCCVITKDSAAIFVDGRYTVQVRKQVPDEVFQFCHLINEPPVQWLDQTLPPHSRVAIDPRLHSTVWLQNAATVLGHDRPLVPISCNPVDDLWVDRPSDSKSLIQIMDASISGESSQSKRQKIANKLISEGVDATLLTSIDSICWLLNIRGNDIPRFPAVLSQAVLHSTGNVDLFLDQQRIPDEFAQHVGSGVSVIDPTSIEAYFAQFRGKIVQLDAGRTNAWFSLTLDQLGARVHQGDDPCSQMKACKNPVEIQGMKSAHIKDGAAMAKFLCWLDSENLSGHLHSEAVLSDTLQRFREEDPSLFDLSFDTISAAGTNAAMCHYNHNNESESHSLSMNSFYLVDSGGQYREGTTDITRTIAVGEPTNEMKRLFTLVLKGHIALANARFPAGTFGCHIDALARQFLWSEGYDYDHGTGHGVGHVLSVHEGPQSLSKKLLPAELEYGMVVSNEPGYYRADGFGIRLENLELIVPIATQGDFSVLGFEALTRCPFDKRGVDLSLLTDDELSWLNHYHQQVWDDISPLVSEDVRLWLKEATSKITR